ncbi:SCO1431 family membrane protein [Streptomyces sp. LZ34]
MTDIAARRTRFRLRTGGPSDDGSLETILGWVLTVVIAMLTVQLGLL